MYCAYITLRTYRRNKQAGRRNILTIINSIVLLFFSGNLHLHEIVSIFFAINEVLCISVIYIFGTYLTDIFLNNKRRGTTLITNFHLISHVITYRRLYVINGSCLCRIFSVLLKTLAKTGMKA